MSEDFPQSNDIPMDTGFSDDQVDRDAPQVGKAEIMDESAEAFHNRMNQLMEEGREIIVFRGAGTKNGIAESDVPGAVDKIVALINQSIRDGKKIAIMFDGDEDNREKPDVGAVFGLVADILKDYDEVTILAAQQKSWYYPQTEGGNLQTATGTEIETYVFPDNTPGGHAALTQSKDLVQYDNYRQVFVGPAGAIAGDQLRDLNEKAEGKQVPVLAIVTHNNPNLTQELQDKAVAADAAGETEKADGFRATLKQREEQPYGMMYDTDGYKAVQPSEYPNVKIDFDESLVPEFQEMRGEPLESTYEVDKNVAHDKAHLLNDSGDQAQVDYLSGGKLETNGYNIGHYPDQSAKDFDPAFRKPDLPDPYYTLAVRDFLKAIDNDPKYLEKAVENQKAGALSELVALRNDASITDEVYASRVKEYADPSSAYKKVVHNLIDKKADSHYARHRAMDG